MWRQMICALYIQHDLSEESCSSPSMIQISLHCSFLGPHRSEVNTALYVYVPWSASFFISFVEIAQLSAHVDNETYNYFISISVSCSRLQQVEGEIEA